MSYFRPAVDAMTGYTPGEQPKPDTPFIKLNTNENPYPPSPQAVEVLRSLDPEWLRRYPNAYAQDFRQAVSEVLAVPADWVMVGNGSDELLSVIIRACAEGRDRTLVYPTPTYSLYRVLAAIQPATVVEVPYGADLGLPIKSLVAAHGAVTFIASPNSPTGHQVPLSDLRTLAQQTAGVLVIDEAYVDFADATALPLVQEFKNVIVLRTMSKGYGLAGLRLGFAVANPALLSGLFKVKDSYNVDAIATLVGTAAMYDQAYKNACAAKVKHTRQQLQTALIALNFAVRPSQGNFVLATPPNAIPSAIDLCQQLKAQHILVRHFNLPGLDDKLRITVGTDEQQQQLLEAIHRYYPASA
ncbi:MAG: histidinol-phosphate transaminase [Cyanobacteria bacterium P01_A01_bin.105]